MLAKLTPSLIPLALYVAAGAGLQILLPRPLEPSLSARLGYSFLLGTAFVGLGCWTVGYLFGVPIDRAALLSLALVPIATGLVMALCRGHCGGMALPRDAWAAPRLVFAPALVLVTGLTIALLADTTARPVEDFDGRMTWGTMARYLESERSVLPSVARSQGAYLIHPRYPILMPLLQVATVDIAGVSLDSYSVRPLYVLFYPALAAVMAPALIRLARPPGAAMALTLLLAAPAAVWNDEGGAIGTYSDFPLGAFLGAGVLVLLHPRGRREAWRGAVAGILIAAAIATKNEGLVLGPLAAIVALVLARRPRPRSGSRLRFHSSALVAGAFAFAAIVLVIAWRWQIPNRNDEAYFETLSLPRVAAGFLERAPGVIRAVAQATWDLDQWGLIFWVAPLLLVAGAARLRGRAVRFSLWLLAGQVTIAFLAYSVVGDLGIIGVTWSRFLVQATVPLAVLLSTATRGAIWASRPPRRGVPQTAARS